ncbi:MAG: PQQ-binding-like beta-propeller repeat protein [Bryobacteraceae bacterium]
MQRACRVLFLASALALFPAMGEDWPQFRGPDGQGHTAATGLPLTWSETENVAWKVPVPGRGWSSPAIANGQLWLTTAVEPEGGGAGRSLRALAFDPETGKQLRDVELFRLEDAGKQHAKNSYASPTPIIEGDRVYVHFGKLGTAALTTSGEIVWKTRFDYDYIHGSGGSPVLYRNLLILSCDGGDQQFVVALNKDTGAVEWKVHRRQRGGMAFSTPLIIEGGGTVQVVSPGAFRTVSYEAATGRELWWIDYGKGFSNVPRPVFAHGMVYVTSGFYTPALIAVKPDGHGDVTNTHVTWQAPRAVPLTPSPVVVGDEIYMVSDNGILTCLDALSGKIHYQQRLGGNFSASPLAADGRIYFQSEEGETTVIAPGKEFQKLASSRVDEQTLASFAVLGDSLYLRSASRLYRLRQSGR